MRPPRIRDEAGLLIIKLDDAAALNDGHTIGLRQALFQAVQGLSQPRVGVDLAAIEFLSSSGVSLLIGLKRRVEERQGRLVLFHVHPNLIALFAGMKLAGFFTIVADQAGAVEVLPPVPSL